MHDDTGRREREKGKKQRRKSGSVCILGPGTEWKDALEMNFLLLRAAAAYNVCMYVWIGGGDRVRVGDDRGTMREVLLFFPPVPCFSLLSLCIVLRIPFVAYPTPIPFRPLIYSIDARRFEAWCGRLPGRVS